MSSCTVQNVHLPPLTLGHQLLTENDRITTLYTLSTTPSVIVGHFDQRL